MTQIRSMPAPVKRPGEIGVHSLDHFAIQVPDANVARKFYSTFGLDVREHADRLDIYVAGNPHRWGTITEGARKKLAFSSFGLFEEDVAAFRQRLVDRRIQILDPPKGLESNGIWFRDHDGNLIEVAVAEKTAPDQKIPPVFNFAPGGKRGAPGRGAAPKVAPRRFAHMLMFTTDVQKAIDFYTQIMGLRLSDRSGDIIAFMHGVHGSDHHMIAFAKSSAPGMHHVSWDVGNINDIGLGALQMLNAGFEKGWGLGRHVLGSNYFHYIKDPWGSWCEYSCDIDHVPVDCDWDTGDHPGADSIYIWGPDMPADFVHNYEADNR